MKQAKKIHLFVTGNYPLSLRDKYTMMNADKKHKTKSVRKPPQNIWMDPVTDMLVYIYT